MGGLSSQSDPYTPPNGYQTLYASYKPFWTTNKPWLELIVLLYFVSFRVHSRLRYYFWDKGLKDYVALDVGIYHDLLLFDQ